MARVTASDIKPEYIKKRGNFVYALYNQKVGAYYKKRSEILNQRYRHKVGIKRSFTSLWTSDIKYARLASRKADIAMAVRELTKGWKPDFYPEDLFIVTLELVPKGNPTRLGISYNDQ